MTTNSAIQKQLKEKDELLRRTIFAVRDLTIIYKDIRAIKEHFDTLLSDIEKELDK